MAKEINVYESAIVTDAKTLSIYLPRSLQVEFQSSTWKDARGKRDYCILFSIRGLYYIVLYAFTLDKGHV